MLELKFELKFELMLKMLRSVRRGRCGTAPEGQGSAARLRLRGRGEITQMACKRAAGLIRERND